MIDSAGNYTFTPAPGFTGEATFSYEVCDDGSPVQCDTAEVVIEVIDNTDPNNNPPIGIEDNIVMENDTTVTGDLLANDSDPDGDNLTITTSPIDSTDNGELTINPDGTYTYDPDPNFVGVDTFTYEVCDDGTPMACDTVLVTIEVLPADGTNDTYATDDASTGDEGEVQGGNVTDNDNEPEGDNVTVTVLDSTDNGTMTILPDGTWTFTPDPDFTGNDQFVYMVCDDGSPVACDSATVSITVLEVNDPPLAINDINTTQVDVPVDGNVLTNDEDPEGDILTVNTTPIDPMGGTVVIDSAGNYTFTPAPGFTGEATFSYEVCDDGSPIQCDTAEVVIEVIDNTDPNNNPPIGIEDNIVMENDTTVTGDLLANDSDPDGDNLTITTSPIDSTDNGELTINPDGTYTYDPDPNFVGVDTFTYEVCDDGTPMACDTVLVTIEVLPADGTNDTYATDDASTGDEGEVQGGNVTDNDNEPEGDNVTVTVLDSTDNGTMTILPDGTWTFTPDPDFTGNDQFVYMVCDDGSPVACDSATVSITVLEVNDPPLAINDINTTQVDVPVDGNVLTNDEDPEGDILTVNTTPIDPMGGTVVIDSAGNYTFTPAPGFTGEATFSYEVCDDGSPVQCDTAEVVIEVIDNTDPNNNPPIGIEDNIVMENDTTVTGDLLANDSDPDGDNLTITTSPIDSTDNGELTINPDGTYTYDPDPNFVGVDTFTYEVCDDGTPMACDTVLVTIEVLPADGTNDTYATDDASTGDEGEVQGGNVTDNDNEPEGDNITVTVLDSKTMEQLPFYQWYMDVHTRHFTGNDQFVYMVCDDGNPVACDSATVSMVLEVNDGHQHYPGRCASRW